MQLFFAIIPHGGNGGHYRKVGIYSIRLGFHFPMRNQSASIHPRLPFVPTRSLTNPIFAPIFLIILRNIFDNIT